jgi:sugar/nucleoside kinase (ribokinase family)
LWVKAPKVRVVNTAGAGTAFSAGILYGLQKGWELEEALSLGVACGSFQCTKKDASDFFTIEAMFEFKEQYMR